MYGVSDIQGIFAGVDIYNLVYNTSISTNDPITLTPFNLSQVDSASFAAALFGKNVGYGSFSISAPTGFTGEKTWYMTIYDDTPIIPVPIKMVQFRGVVVDPINVTVNPSTNVPFTFTIASGWLQTYIVKLDVTNNNSYSMTIDEVNFGLDSYRLFTDITGTTEIPSVTLPANSTTSIYIQMYRNSPLVYNQSYTLGLYGTVGSIINVQIVTVDCNLIVE